jgi:hypothetical protein
LYMYVCSTRPFSLFFLLSSFFFLTRTTCRAKRTKRERKKKKKKRVRLVLLVNLDSNGWMIGMTGTWAAAEAASSNSTTRYWYVFIFNMLIAFSRAASYSYSTYGNIHRI